MDRVLVNTFVWETNTRPWSHAYLCTRFVGWSSGFIRRKWLLENDGANNILYMSTQIRNGRLALGTWQGESARYARYTSFRNVDMFLLLVVDYTNSSHILLIVACPHLFLSLLSQKKKKESISTSIETRVDGAGVTRAT